MYLANDYLEMRPHVGFGMDEQHSYLHVNVIIIVRRLSHEIIIAACYILALAKDLFNKFLCGHLIQFASLTGTACSM